MWVTYLESNLVCTKWDEAKYSAKWRDAGAASLQKWQFESENPTVHESVSRVNLPHASNSLHIVRPVLSASFPCQRLGFRSGPSFSACLPADSCPCLCPTRSHSDHGVLSLPLQAGCPTQLGSHWRPRPPLFQFQSHLKPGPG